MTLAVQYRLIAELVPYQFFPVAQTPEKMFATD